MTFIPMAQPNLGLYHGEEVLSVGEDTEFWSSIYLNINFTTVELCDFGQLVNLSKPHFLHV